MCGRMTYYPGCRKCFSESGFNSKLIKDKVSGEYICERNFTHKYVENEDGMLMTL